MGMLVFSVKEGEYIKIGDGITVTFFKGKTELKIGIEAPRDVTILRQAVYERQGGMAEHSGLKLDRDINSISDL